MIYCNASFFFFFLVKTRLVKISYADLLSTYSSQIQQLMENGQTNWAVEQLTVLSELANLLQSSTCINLTNFVNEMQLHWWKILLNKLARYLCNIIMHLILSLSRGSPLMIKN